jgi:hypothetical protein
MIQLQDRVNKSLQWILFFLLIAAGVFFLWKANIFGGPKRISDVFFPAQDPYTTYTNTDYGISFRYPRAWGAVVVDGVNPVCPEEDTYHTPDTLHAYDADMRFSDADLPRTESFIRRGVRIYALNPEKTQVCGNSILYTLAQKKMTGQEFSSFRLFPAQSVNISGVYNPEASRLDTEGREQYTFFFSKKGTTYVVQPYFSFIPVSGSPEWKEIEESYDNDMLRYLEKGKTADTVRAELQAFRQMAESLRTI